METTLCSRCRKAAATFSHKFVSDKKNLELLLCEDCQVAMLTHIFSSDSELFCREVSKIYSYHKDKEQAERLAGQGILGI